MPIISTSSEQECVHSCHTAAHATFEATQDNVPLPTEIPVTDAIGMPASHDTPHEHRVLGFSQLPPVPICQVFLEPLLLGAVQRQADELRSPCCNVVAAAIEDRGYQLLK